MSKSNAKTSEKKESFWWSTLKTSLLRVPVKFKMFFLKIGCEGELRLSKSSFFHSANPDGKKNLERGYSLL